MKPAYCRAFGSSHSRIAFRRIPIFFVLLSFMITATSLCFAAEEQTSRAIRRDTSDPAKKFALVIGNKDYKDSPLRNPVNDAEDISAVLKGLGFRVQTKTNANRRQMDEAIKEFVQKVQNGDVALFYFSGHGAQVKGENYLLPVGTSIKSESDVVYDAVPVGRILGKLEESKNRINIVILDACRNNPFKGFRSAGQGLSPVDAPVGTFIAYATAPGSVAVDGTGRNSPYTKHLIQALKTEGVNIDNAFRQVLRGVRQETDGKQNPWVSSCLPDEFYFNGSSPSPSSGVPSEPGKPENEQAKARDAERLAALEKDRQEKTKREQNQEFTQLLEARKAAVLEKMSQAKERIENQRRDWEQQSAKPGGTQSQATVGRERLVRARQELPARVFPQLTPTKPGPIDATPSGSNTETGTGVEGTTWSWDGKTQDNRSWTVEFLKGGNIRWRLFVNNAFSHDSGGRWEQNGDSVKFDINGYSLYELTVAGTKMKGTMRWLKGDETGRTISTELTRKE